MSDFIFTFRALTVGYEGRALIRDIDLAVQRGEIVALIGPNGGGKSTILKTAARQLKRVAGTVELDGTDVAALSSGALARQMAVALTERVNPELTNCFAFVAAGRYPHTGRLGALHDADKRAITEAMEAVRCGDLVDRNIARVSDGQRQRLVLARALAQEPRLMLLDEPTSFLDIRHKLELITLLKRLARERGIAMLVSMHEVDLAQRLADRVLCVSGDVLAPMLDPEAAFRAESIERLYDLPTGAYDPMFGGVELPRVEGAPRALVLSSGGGGVSAYRSLQRKGIPFAAAILREGELDHHLAKRLAVATVEEAPYAPIGDEAFNQTRALIERCERVVVAGIHADGINQRMEALVSIARKLDKVEEKREG